jgi:hypothetical protein
MHVDILPHIDQIPLYNAMNFDVTSPTLTGIAPVSGPLNATINSPSGSPFTLSTCPETEVGTGATPHGAHRLAMFTRVITYNCPADMGPPTVATGNSYCPVVTAGDPAGASGGARMAGGGVLEALWPASGGEGMSGTVPTTPPLDSEWGRRMNPTSLLDVGDGTSNTLCMVERLKGWGAGGRLVPQNTAYLGSAVGFLVQGGLIPDQPYSGTSTAGDNRAAVLSCKNSMLTGIGPVTGLTNNDLSGSQWIQYTCHWLGCANTMGPPNSAVCSAGSGTSDIAESGIAPPSSFHRGGANCGFMDGTVRFVTDSVELRLFHHLGTAGGAETMPLPP